MIFFSILCVLNRKSKFIMIFIEFMTLCRKIGFSILFFDNDNQLFSVYKDTALVKLIIKIMSIYYVYMVFCKFCGYI